MGKYYIYKTENGLARVSEKEQEGLEDSLIDISYSKEDAKNILLEYIKRPTVKYRLGYDYVFLPKKKFTYKNDLISSMSIIVLFKIFDTQGNEILFETKDNDLKEQPLKLRDGQYCYLNELFDCCFDKDQFKESNTLNFIPTIKLFKSGCAAVYSPIVGYTKDICTGNWMSEEIPIDKEEFTDIILSNLDLFDVTDNKPAQSTSYITEKVSKEGVHDDYK
ncbi:TPA: hypothetical protein I9080_002141 [Clostridium perfringens]|uniref:Uncharacterized protein n=3 Tax=Clostridium perfringens TaxID=1502 RepID=A0A8H9QZ59_CLOPF|nr:hypothetical protein [Clostridium perfringens]EDT15815.1 hypothetical protein AC3_A0228 [Clostridium perfringens E str. JGS1987]MDU3019855.1 hypothetical protein [Clostridium perfringens]HAT4308331.1 hypothetical protein [Clostridium perfringens]